MNSRFYKGPSLVSSLALRLHKVLNNKDRENSSSANLRSNVTLKCINNKRNKINTENDNLLIWTTKHNYYRN